MSRQVMHYAQCVAAGLIATGLLGCSRSADFAPSAAAGGGATSRPHAALASPGSPAMLASARAAAVRFDSLYFAGQYAATWALLAPVMRTQIPRDIWMQVHSGCPAAQTGRTRIVTTVTIFGDVAIVTEALTGTPAHQDVTQDVTQDVFDYAGGTWGYSPQRPSVYHRDSVPADIAAARAAGLCGSWKDF